MPRGRRHWTARSTEVTANEARAIANIGEVDWRQGDLERAAERYQEAIDIFRAIGDPAGEAYALAELGIVYCRQHRAGHRV